MKQRRYDRRAVAGIAMMATAAIALSACSGSTTAPAESGGSDAELEGRGPIQYVSSPDASGAAQQTIDEWNEANPDEQVEWVELPLDADQQRQQMVQNAQVKGETYSVLNLDVVWTSEFAANRWITELPEDAFPLDEHIPATIEAASYRDVLYGAPLMASVKGFIWYSPTYFAENGYEVPETWDEMMTLTETIAATGQKPWCAGFGSDAATGWPGTDWIEDIVLRQSGTDVYDGWVSNEIPFTDPAIAGAFDTLGEILLNPEYVNAGIGDVVSINSTPFGADIATAVVDGTCPMTHQASFFDGFLTDAGGTVAEDGDVWAFITPGEEAGASAVTGGGEIVAAFSNDEDTIAVQEYLSSAEWANSRVSLGGVISANKGLDPENASSAILSQAIEILQGSETTFRFDASDLMPGAVGAGTFWTGMVDWINGTPTEQVLESIEAGWPSE